jgi:hypothetical protein
MKTIFIALLTFAFLPVATLAQTNAERDARELTDVIRQFNAAFGDVVEGELSPSQIDQFEEMITPIFDADAQHKNMCQLVSIGSVGTGSMIWAFSQPEMAGTMANELELLKSDVEPGGLHDWLVQLTINLITTLGPERMVAVANYECLQRPFANALHSNVPMNSLEMIAYERCLPTNTCSDFDG